MMTLLVGDAVAGALPVGLPGPGGTLRRTWPWLVWLPGSLRLGQQRRRLFPVEVRLDRPAQIVEDPLPLLGTRCDYRPDPLRPALPLRASRPLRYVPVYHHEADRLLRQVVRRL